MKVGKRSLSLNANRMQNKSAYMSGLSVNLKLSFFWQANDVLSVFLELIFFSPILTSRHSGYIEHQASSTHIKGPGFLPNQRNQKSKDSKD